MDNVWKRAFGGVLNSSIAVFLLTGPASGGLETGEYLLIPASYGIDYPVMVVYDCRSLHHIHHKADKPLDARITVLETYFAASLFKYSITLQYFLRNI